jgi:hypothetical protein
MTTRLLFCLALLAGSSVPALADPCGMVPPIYTGDGPPIVRIGLQKTYVSFKDGIESFVIRPGYRGKIDEFGMLIPFPTPPAIRKVPDEIFAHLAAAIDPPAVQLYDERLRFARRRSGAPPPAPGAPAKDEVRVLKEEAVGMYEVAVLEAGSAAALNRWMDAHGYQYPEGMDATCEDYVSKRWCFVAVKTRVGRKSAVAPRPGMRDADPSLPDGAGFDGNVQAMGFRFRTDELVVPMRLSAFNEGQLRNVIYLLTDKAVKADRLPESFVQRQLPGAELLRNLTEPLPVVVGPPNDYTKQQVARLKSMWASLAPRRKHANKNGFARDVFAADLLAIAHDRLANPHEEKEKELLNVAHRLGLRGDDLDRLHRETLAVDHERAADEALASLEGMVLTVIDGDFPRDLLAEHDLTFTPWTMPAERNTRGHYDCAKAGPNERWTQQLWFRGVDSPEPIQPLPAGFELKDEEDR